MYWPNHEYRDNNEDSEDESTEAVEVILGDAIVGHRHHKLNGNDQVITMASRLE